MRALSRRASTSSTHSGTTTLAGPCRTSSKSGVMSLAARFSSIVFAPASAAVITNPAAGYTAPEVPIAAKMSHVNERLAR